MTATRLVPGADPAAARQGRRRRQTPPRPIDIRARGRAHAQDALQHLAAGAVFAAVAGGLAAHAFEPGVRAPAVGGLAAGAVIVLLLRQGAAWLALQRPSAEGWSLLFVLGLELLVAALALGAAFVVGHPILGLTIAVVLQLSVAGLALAPSVLRHLGRVRGCGLVALVTAFLLPVGALAGASAAPADAFVAFAAAAMLYAVTEALIAPVHREAAGGGHVRALSFFAATAAVLIVGGVAGS